MYQNAYKGISKVFLAQILKIIGVIATVIGLALAIVGLNEANLAEAGGGAIAALAGMIIAIIALIFNIIGLNQARKDQNYFKIAFVMTLFALAISIIATFAISANSSAGTWMKFFSTLMELLAFEYVVKGVIVLAEALNNKGMAAFGRKMMILITIGYLALLVIELWGNTAANANGIITMIASVIELVVYVMYIIFLAKSKKMLA